jgi:hypothetical protein
MSDEILTEEEKQALYIETLQRQVLDIVNQVKEEMGIDTPVDIEVREASDNE